MGKVSEMPIGRPICGKCGRVMTPENSRQRPELFLHDDCLPDELREDRSARVTAYAEIKQLRVVEQQRNELLAACRVAVPMLRVAVGYLPVEDLADLIDCMDKIDTAITKATGRDMEGDTT